MDLALDGGHDEVIRLLDQAGAPTSRPVRAPPPAPSPPTRVARQEYQAKLDKWRASHPAPAAEQAPTAEEVRGSRDALRKGEWGEVQGLVAGLAQQSAIKEGLQNQLECGPLPMRPSEPYVWDDIMVKCNAATKSANSQEERCQELETYAAGQEQAHHEFLQEVAEVQQKADKAKDSAVRARAQVKEMRQQPEQAPTEETVQFIQRAMEMEERLAKALVAQLQADPKKLAAQDGKGPKLATLLNCFNASEEVLQAMAEVDGSLFLELPLDDLKEACRVNKASEEAIRDVVYCHQMMSTMPASFVDHVDQCALCICESPDQLVMTLVERKIDMDYEVLRKLHINGPRSLTLQAADFPGAKVIDIAKKLRSIRAIHEDACE